jgi:DNA-binding NtrC family response regulator
MICAGSESPQGTGQAIAEEQSAQILMLDDEESLITLFTRICKKRGHFLSGAADVEAALKSLAEKEFDVLLVDMNLIWMNGVQALQIIRQAGYTTPAIVFSCAVSADEIEELKPLGVIGIMDKNLNNQALFDLITNLLKDKQHP